jgi:hypothetical protein
MYELGMRETENRHKRETVEKAGENEAIGHSPQVRAKSLGDNWSTLIVGLRDLDRHGSKK